MTGPMTDTYISLAEQLEKIQLHESGKRSLILTKTEQLRVRASPRPPARSRSRG